MSMKSHQSRVTFARAKPAPKSKSVKKVFPKGLTKGMLNKFDDSNTGSLPCIGEVTGKKRKGKDASSLNRKDIGKNQLLVIQNKSGLLGNNSRKALSTLDTISQSNSNASTSKFRLNKGVQVQKHGRKFGSLNNASAAARDGFRRVPQNAAPTVEPI